MRIRSIIAALFLSLIPFSGVASQPNTDWWICHQSGHVDKQVVVALTRPVSVLDVSEQKADTPGVLEQNFEKTVKEQLKESNFVPDFSARCDNYPSDKHALEFLKEKLQMLEKSGLKVIWVKFVSL